MAESPAPLKHSGSSIYHITESGVSQQLENKRGVYKTYVES